MDNLQNVNKDRIYLVIDSDKPVLSKDSILRQSILIKGKKIIRVIIPENYMMKMIIMY